MSLTILARVYISFLFLCAVVTIFIIPIRLQVGGDLALFPLALVSLVFFIGGVICLSYWRVFFKRVLYSELFLIVFPVLLVPLSLVNGFDLFGILNDAVRPALFFLNVILVSVLCEYYSWRRFEKWLKFIFYISLFSVGYSFLFLFGAGVKPSASDIAMVLPFVFFVVAEKRLFAVLGFLLLLLGGKLGPAFSALIAVIFYYLVRFRVKGFIGLGALALLFIFAFFGSGASLDDYSKVGVVAKTQYLLEGDISDFDELDKRFLGGRLAEVQYASSPLQGSVVDWVFGKGPGYTYEYEKVGVLYQEDRHGVHFTPISIVLFYGVIYLFVVSYYFCFLMFRVPFFTIFSQKDSRVLLTCLVFCLAFLVNMMTAYGVFTSTLFALALGVLRHNIFIRR